MSKRGNPNWTKGMKSPNSNGRPRADVVDKVQPPVQTNPAMRQVHSDWLEHFYRNDGWYNLLSGHGTASRDKRMSTKFYTEVITPEEGTELWRGDALGARIVEAIVNEMLREQFKLSIADDAEGNDEEFGTELIKRVEQKWRDMQLVPVLFEALCGERARGGAVIVLGADDGATSLEEPLNEDRLKSFEWLTVLEPREATPVAWYADARAPKFGQVEIWQLTPVMTGAPRPGAQLTSSMIRIHESRVIHLPGVKVSRINQHGVAAGHGDSIFTRVNRVLADFGAACSGAGILVHDFATPVFKIKGLADIVAKDNKELFQARMQALSLAMSTARAALIDSEEEYKREQTPVTGLPELLDFFCKLLAAVADTPVSVLFGEAPGGMNASGASGDQLSLWYNRVRSLQTQRLAPILNKITGLIMKTMGGEPVEWSIEFPPLWHPSEKEQADTEKVQTETVVALYDRGLLERDEIRRMPGFAKRYGIVVEHVLLTADPTGADEAAMLANPTGVPVDPNAPPTIAPTGEAGASDLQKEAFNGAQVTALIEVVTAVATKQISRQSAQKMLELAFQLTPDDAAALLGPEDFEPASPDPAPSPFGGGGFPSAKGPAAAPAKPETPAKSESEPGVSK